VARSIVMWGIGLLLSFMLSVLALLLIELFGTAVLQR
jgi:hypothetical protein